MVELATTSNGHAPPKRQLFAFTVAALRARGLTDSSITASGIYSLDDRTELAIKANRKGWPKALGRATVIPYFDDYGNVTLERLRPEHPQTAKNGRPLKYMQPTRTDPRLYVPRGTWPAITAADSQLIVVEGEFKSLALSQAGFSAIAIGGVEMWHLKGKLSLLPEFSKVPLKNRAVFIAFDSDAVDNENVARCEREFAAALKAAGANVRIVRIPKGPNGEKQGADDFFVAHGSNGPCEWLKLLERAEEPGELEANEGREDASGADPGREAEIILAGYTSGDCSRLRFYRGSWLDWSNGRYSDRQNDEVRAAVVNKLNERWTNVKSRQVSDVMDHLKAKAMLSAKIEAPAWLDRNPPFPARQSLATRSEVIHLPSLIERQEKYSVPSSPAFFTTTACDFDLDLQAPPPAAWLEFLQSLWAHDQPSIEALQEWFGYLLTSDARQQKMLLLVGPKRSGKGTIARILTALVGKGNVAAPTLGGLATNFGLWPLIGKSVAIISDARLSGRADQAAVVERLLSISGEDSITIDRKNLQPITCRLPTRFVILTNELPRLSDASGALVSRVILLTTTRSFYGSEDHNLTDKLLSELPGILLWAIGGWHRLRQRGRFLQPASGEGMIDDMNDLASPVAAFIRERCRVGVDERVTVNDLFAAWKRWCESQGREKLTGTVQSFARDLLAAEPGIRKVRLRDGEERTRAYEGVGLLAQW